jgi:maltose-binding protein MalE
MGGTAVTRAAVTSPEAKNLRDLPLFINELEHARPWPPHPQMIAMASNIFTPYCQKAIVGELSPERALEQAAREAQDIVDGKR